MINRKALREQVPHGYCKIIAEKAGVTTKSVSVYFSYQVNSERIENAALQVVAELQVKKNKLLKKSNIEHA